MSGSNQNIYIDSLVCFYSFSKKYSIYFCGAEKWYFVGLFFFSSVNGFLNATMRLVSVWCRCSALETIINCIRMHTIKKKQPIYILNPSKCVNLPTEFIETRARERKKREFFFFCSNSLFFLI